MRGMRTLGMKKKQNHKEGLLNEIKRIMPKKKKVKLTETGYET